MNNRRMVIHVLGEIMLVEALLLLLPCVVDLFYKEGAARWYLFTAALLAVVGVACICLKVPDRRVYYKDGFSIVSIGWIIMSLFGALPFRFTGEIPIYTDALFEAVSGFTTTGASILADVEALSHASLFWRSFTHWIGGMGVLAFLMVLIPVTGGGGNLNLLRAESPGVEVEKLVPKSNRTARILYGIYLVMTVVQLVLLILFRMPLFDALTITFGTAGTGGFSILNSGLAEYSTSIQLIVTVFMVLFGINFNLYFLIICKRARDVFKSEELRAYLTIFFIAVTVVSLDIFIYGFYPTFGESVHHAAFQVASTMSTTGFSTANFDLWPEVSRVILLLVMCIGSCAGSTAGGLKVSRIIILVKSVMTEIKRVINPRSINVVKYDGKRIKDEVVKTTFAYFAIYIFIAVVSLVIISFDRMDFTTNFTGVVATLNNIGPGLGAVGPYGNFSGYSVLSKLVFIVNMLVGRLEIFPIVVLVTSLFKPLRLRKNAPR